MLCFYAWGTEIAGGVQNIIIHCATYCSRLDKPVTIIGFDRCYITRTLKSRKINFLFIDIEKMDSDSIKRELVNKTVVLTSLHGRFGLQMLREFNPKVFFWNVYPPEITNINKLNIINLVRKTSRLITYLDKENSLAFMDINCYSSVCAFTKDQKIVAPKEVYLPVPIVTRNENNYEYDSSGTLNVAYTGRGTLWKVYPCLKLVKDLVVRSERSAKEIILHIITDNSTIYERYLASIKTPSNLKIIYHENLEGKDYINFLSQSIDLSIAMGMSALDSAGLGIPTLLIDYSNVHLPEIYKYKWVYESVKYGLGSDALLTRNKHDISSLLTSFIQDSTEVSQWSELCFKYVNEFHSIDRIAEELNRMSRKATANVETLHRLTPLANNKLIMKMLRLYNGTINRKGAREIT